MRVSQIVLLLCAFICLTQAATSCLSGASADCATDVHNLCASATIEPLKATHYPVLQNATFNANTLTVPMVGAYVAGRTYKEITSTRGAATAACNLGGVFWTKSFDGCQDVFTFSMPWTNNAACGFSVASTTTETVTYVSDWTIKYTDAIVIGSINQDREVSVPLQIFVSFPKRVTVQTTPVSVQSRIDFDAAITKDEFVSLPGNGALTLELTTVIIFPNKLAVAPVEFNAVPARLTPNAITPIENLCIETEGVCHQTWTVEFPRPAADFCSYDGLYNMSLLLITCRDQASEECTQTTISVSFSVVSSYVCAQVKAEAAASGSLIALKSAPVSRVVPAVSEQASSFAIGQTGWFYANIDAAGAQPQSIVFSSITIAATNGELLAANKIATADLAQLDATSLVDFFSFSLYFHSGVFKVAPGDTMTYTIKAVVELTFEGNRKRSMEFTHTADNLVASAKVKLASDEASPSNLGPAPSAAPFNQAALIGGIVGGVAGVALLSVGAALIIRRYRMKNTKAPVITSA